MRIGENDPSVTLNPETSAPIRGGGSSVRPELISAIAATMAAQGLSQVQTAKLCRTDQPTLSKVLRGRTGSITLEKLVGWLIALGRSVELRVGQASMVRPGRLKVLVEDNAESEGTLEAGSERTGAFLRPIYLDHHATTPVDPRVAKVVMRAMMEDFGNANSVDHLFGKIAGELILTASDAVAALVGAAAEDVKFTSGSTEAIRLALAHAISTRPPGRPLRVAVSRVEHKAVLDAIEAGIRSSLIQPAWIEVDNQARIDLASLSKALDRGVDLLCLMAANNEVGTIYPVEEAATMARQTRAAILVDATQAAGRIPLRVHQWHLDYLVLSAHKIYGPKGVGALVAPGIDLGATLSELALGYGGTPNVPGIAGMGEACRLRLLEMVSDESRIASLRDRLQTALLRSVPGLVVNGDLRARLGHNLHISIPGVPNEALVAKLRRKVAVSTGAACTSGTLTHSHVLRAMDLPLDLQEGAIRISLGKFNTQEEIDRAAVEIPHEITSLLSILNGDRS